MLIKKFTPYIYTLMLLCIGITAKAQNMVVIPATTPPFTPINLLEQVFLGDGIEVINITYNGDPAALGFFQNGFADIGINKGIVMSTGNAIDIPTNANTITNTSGNTSGGSDPDLAILANNTINDASIYTIDFIPAADTLRFKYVFASEEYTDFVCSVNDVFGFFISGPGISGTFSNNSENIALIPGTSDAVGVSTVNGGVPAGGNTPCILTNNAYYVDNDWPAPTYQVIHDGFTTVLVATAVVQPCQQYKIQLKIGDALDQIYDSAVFLEANSFGTNSLSFNANTPSFDNTIAEGCDGATIDFNLKDFPDNPYPISYSVGGSAIMGVDYDTIPLSGIIPVGSTTFSFNINAIADNVVEGIDTVEFIINITPCEQDTFYLYITDNELPDMSLPGDTIICLGDSINVDATLPVAIQTGGTFVNDTTYLFTDASPATSYMNVTGVPITTMQTGVIDSVCIDIDHFWVGDIDLYLIAPDGQFMELVTDVGGNGINYTGTCFTPKAITPIKGQLAGAAPFTGNWLPEGNFDDLNGSDVNGFWRLRALDDAFGFDGVLKRWSITFAAPYSVDYLWSPTNNVDCINCPVANLYPTQETSYTNTATDAYGCITEDSINLIISDGMPAPNAYCDSVCTNLIRIGWNSVPLATGYEVNVDGTGWTTVNPGDTTFTATGLAANQTVVFEVRGLGSVCNPVGIDTVTCMTALCNAAITVDNLEDADCHGNATGSVTVSAISCTPPFMYALNNGTAQSSGTFTGLPAGTHSIIVTDANNCSDTATFTINQPAPLSIATVKNDVSCANGNDAWATVTVAGGTPVYSYEWSTAPIQDSSTAVGLGAGVYYIVVTDSLNCVINDTVTITVPPALASTVTEVSTSCNGSTDGSATVNVTGGTPIPSTGYTYNWNTTPPQTTATITGVAAGTYIVTITDNNNCTTTDTAFVSEPAPLTLVGSSVPAGCSGAATGSATVNPSGGTPNYTYQWNTTPVQTAPTALNLPAGTYFVTVTDANMCSAIDTITVLQTTPVSLTTNVVDASCFGLTDGSATVTASGGTPGYTYQWNSNPIQFTATASNLGGGNYQVIVTDANGCPDTANVTVNAPVVFSIGLTKTDVSCNGLSDGTTNVVPMGGTPNYSYIWNTTPNQLTAATTGVPAGMYTTTVTDANGCQVVDSIQVIEPTPVVSTISSTALTCNNSGDGTATVVANGGSGTYSYLWNTTPTQTTATASNLAAGNYMVTITDGSGCSSTNSVTVTEPTPLVLVMDSTGVSCNGGGDGAALVTASGGTPNYTYLWSNGMNTPNIINLNFGTYTVTVTDANGCQAIASVTVDQPPFPILATYTVTDVTCNNGSNGSIAAVATGGAGGFTYNWSSGSTSATATNLTANSYTVTITDMNGCFITNTLVVDEPSAITLIMAQTPSSCFGGTDGTASVAASGGTPNATTPYTYAWNTTPPQFTDTVSGLVGGQVYTVTVTDDNGCTKVSSIQIGQPDPITLTTSQTEVSCSGEADGTAMVTASGGTPGYTYLWNNGATTDSISGLIAGTYSVVVTDVEGCSATIMVTITEPTPLQTTMSSTLITCKGAPTGSATVGAAGGTPGYTFQWDANANNATEGTVENLLAGWYSVVVTDANGCSVVDSVEVTEPAEELSANLTKFDVNCFGDRDGEINITAMGGIPPYKYSFDSVTFNQATRIVGLEAGLYTVYVSDGGDCIFTDTISIAEPAEMTVDLGNDTTILLQDVLTLSPNITNGIAPYSYAWTPELSILDCLTCPEVTITGMEDRTMFFVEITDGNGCEATDDIIVNIEKPRNVFVAGAFSPNGDGVNDVLFVQGDKHVAKVMNFQIYDRWGELLYQVTDVDINDPSTGWDGKFKNQDMNSGVFGWILEVEFIDGERIIYKGNSSLIR